MNVIPHNLIVEILTPTPRRFTSYRALASNGQHGLIVASVFYATRHIEIPELTEEDSPSPIALSITIGNADNFVTDLVSNAANRKAQITISKVKFDASWAITSTDAWFVGVLGRPAFDGPLVVIECHADMGRRGTSPYKQSKTLMTSHTPPAAGTKQPWFTGGN
jgi:hypothetical protein